jgi:hypothetical protein
MMAWHHRPRAVRRLVDTLALPVEAAGPVRAYLGRLDAALPAPARARHEVLAEVGDGLACAVHDGMAAGAAPGTAARAAVAELGDAAPLAAAFAAELARRTAHRIGLALIATGPLVGAAWLAAGGPGGAAQGLADLLAAAPLYPLLLAVAVPAALVALTGAGAAARRLPPMARWSGRAAVVAAGTCLVADVTLLVAALGAPAGRGWLGIAATASLLRLALAATAARRVARLELAAG